MMRHYRSPDICCDVFHNELLYNMIYMMIDDIHEMKRYDMCCIIWHHMLWQLVDICYVLTVPLRFAYCIV